MTETSTVRQTLISTHWRPVQVEKSVIYGPINQFTDTHRELKYLESQSDVPESC